MAKVEMEWNRAGLRALLNSEGIQKDLDKRAQAIAASAETKLDPKAGYTQIPDYDVQVSEGNICDLRVVIAVTNHARYSEAKNKTLSKSIDAGKG